MKTLGRRVESARVAPVGQMPFESALPTDILALQGGLRPARPTSGASGKTMPVGFRQPGFLGAGRGRHRAAACRRASEPPLHLAADNRYS